MAVLAQLIDDVVVNKFELNKDRITIGRHPDNDIMIDDISVSGHHAIVEIKKSKYMDGLLEYFVVDCGSKNGTFVNDRAIKEQQRLLDGDVLKVAWNQFKLIAETETELAKTAHVLQ